MNIRKLSDIGGVDVTGVDLRAPRTQAEDRTLLQMLNEHGLICFRDQKLTKPQLVTAGDPFGGTLLKRAAGVIDSDVPGIATLSTRGPSGDVIPKSPDELIGHSTWHTDEGYLAAPTRGKILYAVDVPEDGGLTGFIDGTATYNALPEKLRARIEGLHVVQDWNGTQAYLSGASRYKDNGDKIMTLNRFPNMAYPLVHIHPITGAKVLNCPPLWATGIEELPGAEGEALLDEVIAHAIQEKFQYWHKYSVGDAVLWDNWRFMHAASGTRGRYVRTMWVIAIKGGATIAREAKQAA